MSSARHAVFSAAGMCWPDHRLTAGMDDDLGIVDAPQVDRRDPEVAVPGWRGITTNGTPARANTTAWACPS
jgi:hypothetical protein